MEEFFRYVEVNDWLIPLAVFFSLSFCLVLEMITPLFAHNYSKFRHLCVNSFFLITTVCISAPIIVLHSAIFVWQAEAQRGLFYLVGLPGWAQLIFGTTIWTGTWFRNGCILGRDVPAAAKLVSHSGSSSKIRRRGGDGNRSTLPKLEEPSFLQRQSLANPSQTRAFLEDIPLENFKKLTFFQRRAFAKPQKTNIFLGEPPCQT